MTCCAVTRVSAGAPPICGAIFEAARPGDELNRLEALAAAPDFWKDQSEAQKVLQRRRRLEEDRDLVLSLRKRSDDLAVLAEWSAAGEPVDAEFAQALETLDGEVQAGEIKKMLGGEHDRKNAILTIHPGAGGRNPRTGPRCSCVCTCGGPSVAVSRAS